MKPLALASTLAACAPDPLDALASDGRGRVTAVDGAVLTVAGTPVRLAGVVLEAEGEAALRELTLGREVERLRGGAAADPFGRPVAQLRRVDGRVWVQGRLLERGLARVHTWPENRAAAREMLTLEAKARSAGRGGWANPDWRVLTPEETAGVEGFTIVEGRVLRAERRGASHYLDFGADARHDFSARVPAESTDAFAAAGVAPGELPARLVRVRGTLRPSGWGPVMTVDHPEQLELLKER